jgi:hypothetical protein
VSLAAAAVPAVVSLVELSSLPQLAVAMSARAAKASIGFLRRLVDGPDLVCMATPLCSLFTMMIGSGWVRGEWASSATSLARSSAHEQTEIGGTAASARDEGLLGTVVWPLLCLPQAVRDPHTAISYRDLNPETVPQCVHSANKCAQRAQ